MIAARAGTRLTAPVAASMLLHAVAIAVIAIRPPTAAMPALYTVELIAAPAGPRAIGEVKPAEAEPATVPGSSGAVPLRTPVAAPISTTKVRPEGRAIPLGKSKPPPVPPAKSRPAATATPDPPKAGATPSTPASAASKSAAPGAMGGATGDKGADVATVRTEGTAFPFPGYLSNIVRQIALNFRPRSPAASLRCEVSFLLHRDGSVTNLRFVSRSGSYAFDLEAQGAIEAASRSKTFGALPADFVDDVLPVTFAFDPRLIR